MSKRYGLTTINDWCEEHQGNVWGQGLNDIPQKNIYFYYDNNIDLMLMLSGDNGTVYLADGSVHKGNGMHLGSDVYVVGYIISPVIIGGE